jgi:hypothetical protein
LANASLRVNSIHGAWPEVAALAEKVARGEPLSGLDEHNFKELAEATG